MTLERGVVDAGARAKQREPVASTEFVLEGQLRAMPKHPNLAKCLERLPVEWLDTIVDTLGFTERAPARRAERGAEVVSWLKRMDQLVDLLDYGVGDDARALLAWMIARDGAGLEEVREAPGAPQAAEFERWVAFEHPGALGQLRRAGLVHVGLEGQSWRAIVAQDMRAVLKVAVRD